jgi:hypothetical protein
MVLMAFGTVLALVLAAVWVLGRAGWEEIDPRDPGKILAQQIFLSVRKNVCRIANFVSRKEIPPEGSRGA